MNMQPNWFPFDPNTCPKDVPIIVWNKNTEIAIVSFSIESWGPAFHTFGDSGWGGEDDYHNTNLPTHYMLAPEPPQ